MSADRPLPGVVRWVGMKFTMRDGDELYATGVYMAPSHHSVCVLLKGRRGDLMLTGRELAMNVAGACLT